MCPYARLSLTQKKNGLCNFGLSVYAWYFFWLLCHLPISKDISFSPLSRPSSLAICVSLYLLACLHHPIYIAVIWTVCPSSCKMRAIVFEQKHLKLCSHHIFANETVRLNRKQNKFEDGEENNLAVRIF